jgi:hypothetical protein
VSSTRIYVAAALGKLAKAQSIATRLVAAGYQIGSTWFQDRDDDDQDPYDPGTRQRLLHLNFNELRACHILVAYLADGNPRCTFGEIGFAYALKIPVVMALPPGHHPNRCLLDSHELCTVYTSDELLEGVVAGIVAERKRASGGEFVCPKCGGHSFRTGPTAGPVELWERSCKGKRIQEGRTYHYERCDFTWLGADDEKYGLVNHGSGT